MSPTSLPQPPRAFISYSHDSEDHKNRVLALANQLRQDGIDAQIDQYLVVPTQGFPRWMEQQIKESDFVLVVCTSTYSKRFSGDEEPGKGLGGRWEGAIITQHLYMQGANNSTFIPILIGDATSKDIPILLAGTVYYRPDTPDGYEALYRRLSNQHATPPPPLGTPRQLSNLSVPSLFASGISPLERANQSSANSPWSHILHDVFIRAQMPNPELAPCVMVGLTPANPLDPITMDDEIDERFGKLCFQLFHSSAFLVKLDQGVMHAPFRNDATRNDDSVGYAYNEGSIGVALNLHPGQRNDNPNVPWNISLVHIWRTLHRLLTWSAWWPRNTFAYDGPLHCRIALGNLTNVVAYGLHRSELPISATALNNLPGWTQERTWDSPTDAHDLIEDVLASLARQLQFPNYRAIKSALRAEVQRN